MLALMPCGVHHPTMAKMDATRPPWMLRLAVWVTTALLVPAGSPSRCWRLGSVWSKGAGDDPHTRETVRKYVDRRLRALDREEFDRDELAIFFRSALPAASDEDAERTSHLLLEQFEVDHAGQIDREAFSGTIVEVLLQMDAKDRRRVLRSMSRALRRQGPPPPLRWAWRWARPSS